MVRRLSRLSLPLAGAMLLAGSAGPPQDFEAEYERMIAEFAGSLTDTTTSQALADRASDLSDRIQQHRRDNRSDLSDAVLDRLRDLRREVIGFGAVVRVVGQTSNSVDVSIETFNAMSERLGLEPRVLQTHESGLELVRVDVGSYGSILFRNPTTTTFVVRYGVNDPERPGGIGSAACERYSVLSGRFNSRDRDIESIEFTNIDAQDSRVGRCD